MAKCFRPILMVFLVSFSVACWAQGGGAATVGKNVGENMSEILENDTLRVVANSYGAEITSIRSVADDKEYLWQTAPGSWKRQAPILFPIVGTLKDGKYRFEGQEYKMSGHGFANKYEFSLEKREDDRLVYVLSDSETTREQYPFPFVLRIEYRLKENSVATIYTVENPADKPLFFSIGGHPGFVCPLEPDETFEDYRIEFNKRETADRWFNEKLLQTKPIPRYLDNQNTIHLKKELFATSAMVFMGLESNSASLISKKSGRRVTVDFTGFPFLGIWTRPDDSPFICIEPWYGHRDFANTDGDFKNKHGIIRLESGKTFQCQFTITIEPQSR